jgi:3-dehydroquinate synthase
LVRVSVPVSPHPYEVVVGSGIIETAGELLPDLPAASSAFVVADRNVLDTWFGPLAGALSKRDLSVVQLAVPAGEEAKTLQVYEALLHQLAIQEAHRDDVLVALGGGATGDAAGFVASTYMRGMPIVQVPTTLTAQVDAAIGGKNGLNLPEGKNLVGTFSQPLMVLADVGTLATLTDRDFRSGLAEVAKYALTIDTDLLEKLERDPSGLLARDADALEQVVSGCVAAKARVVAKDERDLGPRLVLNYGHTLGHALERLESFAGRSHGEAIAVGMVFAAHLAERRALADPGLVERTIRLLTSLGLEVSGSLPPSGEIEAAFRMDKKFQGGVRFVLLESVGSPVLVSDVSPTQVREVLHEMGAAA